MPTKHKKQAGKLVKVGVVGVDSGQVMICDPTYIDGDEWQETPRDAACVPTPVHKDRNTGRTYAYAGFGIDPSAVDVTFEHWDAPLEDYGGKTPNDVSETAWELCRNWLPDGIVKGEFSYRGCCIETLSSEHGFGQLFYRLGHAGAGIVSRTQSGDGCYPVFAELDEDGCVARLVVDFRILDYENDITGEDYERQLW